jgi:cytochrome c oxidase assembly protein subunit 11
VTKSERPSGDRFLGLKLVGLVVAMFLFGFAALPPLYDVFCEVTGFSGRTASAAAAATDLPADPSRVVRVEFIASVPSGAPWEFRAAQSHLDVRPGEPHQARFVARNITGQPLVAQAVPSVAPGPAAKFFRKFECFCFTQQAFAANETRELTVAFELDPQLPQHIDTVTLSYTFFAVSE